MLLRRQPHDGPVQAVPGFSVAFEKAGKRTGGRAAGPGGRGQWACQPCANWLFSTQVARKYLAKDWEEEEEAAAPAPVAENQAAPAPALMARTDKAPAPASLARSYKDAAASPAAAVAPSSRRR